MNTIDQIRGICADLASPLVKISGNEPVIKKEYIIDCSLLHDDYFQVDVRKTGDFSSVFSDVDPEAPVLYWFEITSGHSSDDVMKYFGDYRNTKERKAIPATRKMVHDSEILYVGKVKRRFDGRLVQHLGYYKVSGTQALQLHYWARNMPLGLTLHTLVFPHDMADLMGVIENKFAARLRPILGKHR